MLRCEPFILYISCYSVYHVSDNCQVLPWSVVNLKSWGKWDRFSLVELFRNSLELSSHETRIWAENITPTVWGYNLRKVKIVRSWFTDGEGYVAKNCTFWQLTHSYVPLAIVEDYFICLLGNLRIFKFFYGILYLNWCCCFRKMKRGSVITVDRNG